MAQETASSGCKQRDQRKLGGNVVGNKIWLAVQRSQPLKWSRHRRRRRVRSEGAGGAIHHDLILVDSSDDDAPFVVPAPARPSRRLVLVPEVEGTPQSIQDREWDDPPVLGGPGVTLSNRFGVLEDRRGAEVHVLSDDEAASTMSDTGSVVGQPRVRRLLSLVWEADRPQPPAEGAHPESVVREEEDSFESERGISEVDEEAEEVEPPSGAPVELDVRARSVAIGLASLDEFHVPEIFKSRARVMRTVPLFLKGAFRGALRVAFEGPVCKGQQR